MSGETLRAPRQQLRLLRASAFDLALDFQGLLKSSFGCAPFQGRSVSMALPATRCANQPAVSSFTKPSLFPRGHMSFGRI